MSISDVTVIFRFGERRQQPGGSFRCIVTDAAIRESTAKAVATMRRFRGCYIVVDGDMLVTVVVDGEDSR